ncbi:hypothetical protein GCM10010174_86400 [Kutzneria viridogrisea]|uniref:DUF8083 domain-containing protein n=2 Tax=Kutzneria TaxID=43356 RepID=W5WKZ5_9PSEU|nr:hypothetical protein [Kutzneria albida]AHI01884.1 hypothetical protein KALB_8527 [Kutzneria albida DSM 43870]MBA8929694.1 hypothetical protein [Kutzneria viridogrisea]
MPRPFVAYLRVYEPLSAFDAELAVRMRAALDNGPLARSAAGDRERELWLRSQLSRPAGLLPCEPVETAPLDLLVLDPAEVPTGPAASAGPGPLVCPLDLRARSAAALAGFLSTSSGVLRAAALGMPADTAKARANSVMAEVGASAVHVVSTTWTIPLPWFALVDADHRHVVLAPREDAERQVAWRVAMADARRRVARAHTVVREALGENGPARVLRDTGRWLEHFHPHSAVELDYGGLVQLLDDEQLLEDSSAVDVQAIVDALEQGDTEEVALRYEQLREFWGELAAHERYG